MSEPNQNRLDETLEALQQMPVPDRPLDSEILARLTADSLSTVPSQSYSRRRTIVRIASWSLAASILVVVSGLLLFTGTSNVALADVLKAAENYKLVKYTLSQIDETKEGSVTAPLIETAYADLKAPRSRTETRHKGSLNGALDFESIYIRDVGKNITMHIITEEITEKGKTDPDLIKILKDFEKLGVPRKSVALNVAYGDFTPATAELKKSILENFRELEKHKDAVSTKTKLGNKAALKYRIEEEHKLTILWVDQETKLPLKLESEITDPKILHPDVTKMKFEMTDFEWDPKGKEFKNIDEIFSVTPPKGYQVEDLRKQKEEKKDK